MQTLKLWKRDGVKNTDIYKWHKKVLNNDKYLVKTKSSTLTRMENRLVFADFKKKQGIYFWKLPNVVADNFPAILLDNVRPWSCFNFNESKAVRTKEDEFSLVSGRRLSRYRSVTHFTSSRVSSILFS